MSKKWVYEDSAEQKIFKQNVKSIVKKDMGMTLSQFAQNIGWDNQFMRLKMSRKGRFNLRELLFISKQLGEYVEDLCDAKKFVRF